MFEIFTYPFMVRALLAGIVVSFFLGWLGVFVISRRMSFIGDGIAHSSLAGIAIALFLGWSPLYTAIICSVFLATLIYFLEKKVKLNSDTAIAIIFSAGMALGIILLNFYQGYQPELISYLFGNILTVGNSDLQAIFILGVFIFLILVKAHHKIFFITFDPIGAYLSGIRTWVYELLLYIIIAVTIVLSVKLMGIILVNALLVIPGAISNIFAKSFRSFTFLTIFLAVFIVIFGIILSFYLDLPSGATIVATAVVLFCLSVLGKYLFRK